jgi:hypothetical protein
MTGGRPEPLTRAGTDRSLPAHVFPNLLTTVCGGQTSLIKIKTSTAPGQNSHCVFSRRGSKLFGNHSSRAARYGGVWRGSRRMFLILLVLGILLSAAGGALIAFAILINELPAATTQIFAGTVAVVGGLVLVGLSAVVSELARITAALKGAQTVAQLTRFADRAVAEANARDAVKEAARASEGPAASAAATAAQTPSAPAPASVPADVSASAIERLRASIPRSDRAPAEAEDVVPLSPNGQHAAAHVAAAHVEALPRSAGAAAVETREPNLDFLFRPRPSRSNSQPAFESLWPTRPVQPADARQEVARVPAAPHAEVAASAHEPAQEPAPPRSATILKSGVVDGMAYTLYADGSIEAQLPQGTVRFGSIAELRAHIEGSV